MSRSAKQGRRNPNRSEAQPRGINVNSTPELRTMIKDYGIATVANAAGLPASAIVPFAKGKAATLGSGNKGRVCGALLNIHASRHYTFE